MAEPWSMPFDNPLYGEAPYYISAEVTMVQVKVDPSYVANVLPEGVFPVINEDKDKSAIMILAWIKYKDDNAVGPYNELIFSVFGTTEGMSDDKKEPAEGLFIVNLYLDSGTAIAAGREIWGFPKREAILKFKPNNHGESRTRKFAVKRLGDMDPILGRHVRVPFIAKGTFKPLYDGDPELGLFPTILNEKIIPSVTGGLDVWQLTATTLSDQKITNLKIGTATIELIGGKDDPLNEIPIGEVMGAVQYDFTCTWYLGIPDSWIVYDYLTTDIVK
jgi:acetoacetate decarboxylase